MNVGWVFLMGILWLIYVHPSIRLVSGPTLLQVPIRLVRASMGPLRVFNRYFYDAHATFYSVYRDFLSHPLQVPHFLYNPLNRRNHTEAFNLAPARITMHQSNIDHTHIRSALNLLCRQSKLGTYPLSPSVHPLVDRRWLGADFHTYPKPS